MYLQRCYFTHQLNTSLYALFNNLNIIRFVLPVQSCQETASTQRYNLNTKKPLNISSVKYKWLAIFFLYFQWLTEGRNNDAADKKKIDEDSAKIQEEIQVRYPFGDIHQSVKNDAEAAADK